MIMFTARFPFESIFKYLLTIHLEHTKIIDLIVKNNAKINTLSTSPNFTYEYKHGGLNFDQVGAEIFLSELAGLGMAGLREWDTAAAHYQSKRCYTVAMGEKQRSDTDKAVRKRPGLLTLNFLLLLRDVNIIKRSEKGQRCSFVVFRFIFNVVFNMNNLFFGITLSSRKVLNLLFEQ
jgi:hypothetical protein